MASIFQQPFTQVVDENGPVSGATVSFKAAGTSTDLAVYSDSGLTTALPNPMTTNSAGYLANNLGSAVTIFMQDELYDVVVKDAGGSILFTIEDYNPTSGKQDQSDKLDNFAGLSGGANKLPYFTGTDSLAQTTISSFGRSLLDDADASAGRTTLELDNRVPVGVVLPYAGSTAPTGWALCDGSAVSRTTYADLFAALSTTYGVGDGSTTFNLPDMRGRVAAGKDDMGGAAANRLHDTSEAGGNIDGDTLGATGGNAAFGYDVRQQGDGSPASATDNVASITTETSQSGIGRNRGLLQPTMILNHIIKLTAG